MIKKIFVVVSVFLTLVLLLTGINSHKHQLDFSQYKAVNIFGIQEDVHVADRETVTERLEQFAREHDIVIARRIVEPNETGEVFFTYDVYGQGDLPDELEVASEESVGKSDLANSYLIVSGEVDTELLRSEFDSMGFLAITSGEASPINLIMPLIAEMSTLISFVIFILTFAALTIIYRVKDLRLAGIRLLAGESSWQVTLRPVKEDLILIVSSYVINLMIGLVSLFSLDLATMLNISLIAIGLLVLPLMYSGISMGLSIIYLMSLRRHMLVDLLKGKLPLYRLISLMLVGQMIAVVVVGWSINETIVATSKYQELLSGQQIWQSNPDLVTLSAGMSADGGNASESSRRDKIWYNFAHDAVENYNAMLVRNNLEQYVLNDVSDGIHKDDYVPIGNTIYVTPNYLDREGIDVSPTIREKLHHLEQGEFGLLLPEKLKSESEKYIEIFTDDMNSYGKAELDADSEQLYTFQAVVDYVPNNQKRFLYNDAEIVRTQFLDDPIIVVITPKSMGETLDTFLTWGADVASMLYSDYEGTIDLLKQHGVYEWVSYVEGGQLKYLQNMASMKTNLIILIAGAVLSLVTSILLFVSMNILYFEQFRRELFIRRIAGMSPWENHQYYLMAQLGVITVSSGISWYLTGSIGVASGTFGLFTVSALGALFIQARREHHTAMTVLKGK